MCWGRACEWRVAGFFWPTEGGGLSRQRSNEAGIAPVVVLLRAPRGGATPRIAAKKRARARTDTQEPASNWLDEPHPMASIRTATVGRRGSNGSAPNDATL